MLRNAKHCHSENSRDGSQGPMRLGVRSGITLRSRRRGEEPRQCGRRRRGGARTRSGARGRGARPVAAGAVPHAINEDPLAIQDGGQLVLRAGALHGAEVARGGRRRR